MRSNTAKHGAALAGLLVLVLTSQSGAQQSGDSGDETPVTANATPQEAPEDKPRESEARTDTTIRGDARVRQR